MRMILIALASLIAVPAMAADLPVKAAPMRAPIFYGGSGIYCGMGTGGEATKVGGNGVATYEAGALLNANCGYTFALSNDRWIAIQGNYAYANVGADSLCAVGAVCAANNRNSGDVKVMYGAPLSVLSGIFSNAAAGFPALPPVPPGTINTTMHPYLSAGVRLTQDQVEINGILGEKKTRVKGLLGLGAIYQTNANTTVNTFADWTIGSGKFLLVPGAEIKVGSSFRFGVTVNYGMGG